MNLKKIIEETINDHLNKDNFEFVIEKNKFKLILNNQIISESEYTIESPDEWFKEKYLTLYNLITFEKFRGKGYAKKMLEYIFDFVKNKFKINIITLIVDKDNIKAYNLYKNMGFETFLEYDDSYSLIKKLN